MSFKPLSALDTITGGSASRVLRSLPFGAEYINKNKNPTISYQDLNSKNNKDWRAKLTLSSGLAKILLQANSSASSIQAANEYAGGNAYGEFETTKVAQASAGSLRAPLAPLLEANGIIFPYVPGIILSHNANFSPVSLTHSNYESLHFENHQSQDISITCTFTANSNAEADYIRAVIHFLRVITKMFFGQDTSPIAGTPPPVLRFNAMGDYVFKNVPVVVKSFNTSLPTDVHYIPTTDGLTQIPTKVEFNIVVKDVYSRSASSNRFSLKDFADGKLIGSSTHGGFI